MILWEKTTLVMSLSCPLGNIKRGERKGGFLGYINACGISYKYI